MAHVAPPPLPLHPGNQEPSTDAAAPAPPTNTTYVVQEGDTIAGIAIKHGLREFDLRQCNHLLGGHAIYQGQTLKIRHRVRARSSSLPSKTLEQLVSAETAACTSRRTTSPMIAIPEAMRSQRAKHAANSETNQKDNNDPASLDDEKRPVSPCPHEPAPEPVGKCALIEPTSIPKLLGATANDILFHPVYTKYLVPRLEACLPARFRGYDWQIAFSLAQHGASLSTLYRNVQGKQPTLVVVETADGDVFGGFATSPWASSQSYYGNGECFLFSTYPKFEHFGWKGNNSLTLFSNDKLLAMGGGGGFAWAVNCDLSRGSSAHSLTFENRCLTHRSDFDVINLEVWTLVSKY